MKVILVFWFPVFFSKACCNSDSWISLWNLFFCSRNFGDLFLISFLCPHYYSDVPCFMTHSLCWVLTGFFQSGNSCPYIQENILKLISLTFCCFWNSHCSGIKRPELFLWFLLSFYFLSLFFKSCSVLVPTFYSGFCFCYHFLFLKALSIILWSFL